MSPAVSHDPDAKRMSGYGQERSFNPDGDAFPSPFSPVLGAGCERAVIGQIFGGV